jgi:hypothetical protein
MHQVAVRGGLGFDLQQQRQHEREALACANVGTGHVVGD